MATAIMPEGFSGPAGTGGLLARRRIIARPGFNRWLVPPAALAIHLCIGMAYGFSVFWLPLQTALSKAAGGAGCRVRGQGGHVCAKAFGHLGCADGN